MKFKDFPYERVDVKAAIKEIAVLTAEMTAAKSADDAINCMLKLEKLSRHAGMLFRIANIRYTQNTKDEFYAAEQEYYAAETPALDEAQVAFEGAVLKCKFRAQLEERFGKIIFKNYEIHAKTISKEVIPLLEEEERLGIEYRKVQSSVMVDFNGEKLPATKMAIYTTDPDREVRHAAWTAMGNAYAKNGAEYDRIYDAMVKVRTKIARALGCKSFTELGYLRMTRNCYDVNDVEVFRKQVKTMLVPLVTQLKRDQAKRIGLDSLKFYDEALLTKKGNPRPTCQDEELYSVGIESYRTMKPQTEALINSMDSMGMFDLYSREGKMPGGYCDMLPEYNVPFIFANFNGTSDDVEVFTHEGGHALAAFLNRDNELAETIWPTYEACEIHSMSMEFLFWPRLEAFYGDRADQGRVIHLINALYFIPYGCMVDEFQHIVYDNPGMTPSDRNQRWAQLEKEYFPDGDFDKLPFYSQGRRWQRQNHIFESPFYYIDYCIAQTCALQIMAEMLDNGWEAAWDKYLKYTMLGGKYTLVEMLEKSGIESPFKPGALDKIVAAAQKYITENQDKI